MAAEQQDSAQAELVARIEAGLGEDLRDSESRGGELILRVEQAGIARALKYLRDDAHCRFAQLVFITGVDWPERNPRFDVVYGLLSVSLNQRVRVKIAADEDSPVPSAAPLFSTAVWFEREVWDMFGIFFDGNPDLRRILTDYGFEGHPLRKDFPLTGFVEPRWDAEARRVVYEPVQLTQDFRNFDFLSPWEGMTDVMLPGDEKAVQPPTGAPANPDPGARAGETGAGLRARLAAQTKDETGRDPS